MHPIQNIVLRFSLHHEAGSGGGSSGSEDSLSSKDTGKVPVFGCWHGKAHGRSCWLIGILGGAGVLACLNGYLGLADEFGGGTAAERLVTKLSRFRVTIAPWSLATGTGLAGAWLLCGSSRLPLLHKGLDFAEISGSKIGGVLECFPEFSILSSFTSSESLLKCKLLRGTIGYFSRQINSGLCFGLKSQVDLILSGGCQDSLIKYGFLFGYIGIVISKLSLCC